LQAISFTYHRYIILLLVDKSSKLPPQTEPVGHAESSQALLSPEPSSVLNIEYPALHPISTEWNNITSVHYYQKEEFLNRLARVHNKSTLVYDVLRTSREGTNMKKNNPDNFISIGELIVHPDRDKKVERLYYELRNILPPPQELSLPYKNTKQSRKKALIERIMRLYPGLDPEKAVYKTATGIHRDKDIEYPSFFEIIAIPYRTEILDNEYKSSKFIGTVNYSMSPRDNSFEGQYVWTNKRDKEEVYDLYASSAKEMLSHEGFKYYDHAGPKVKLPSIIIANLVSPRVDYHEDGSPDTSGNQVIVQPNDIKEWQGDRIYINVERFIKMSVIYPKGSTSATPALARAIRRKRCSTC
jgi:hypothetical protein